METLCLTNEELIELTDTTKKKLQIEWLSKEGFAFKVSRRGNIKVARSHFIEMMGARNKSKPSHYEINVNALEAVLDGQAA